MSASSNNWLVIPNSLWQKTLGGANPKNENEYCTNDISHHWLNIQTEIIMSFPTEHTTIHDLPWVQTFLMHLQDTDVTDDA